MTEDAAERIAQQLTDRERRKNSTLQSLSAVGPQLERIVADRDRIDTIVDLGCGRGAFVAALGDELGASEIHGVELTDRYREETTERGVTLHTLDLESDPLPFGDEDVDLVISFGLLEHLTWYDHVLEESHRVLRDDGWLWLAVPNLGSYLNRLALLVGYQPRNVELSTRRAVGLFPAYPHEKPIGHVHAPTYRALRELVVDTGFIPESAAAVSPYQDGYVIKLIDRVVTRRPSLARRLALLARAK